MLLCRCDWACTRTDVCLCLLLDFEMQVYWGSLTRCTVFHCSWELLIFVPLGLHLFFLKEKKILLSQTCYMVNSLFSSLNWSYNYGISRISVQTRSAEMQGITEWFRMMEGNCNRHGVRLLKVSLTWLRDSKVRCIIKEKGFAIQSPSLAWKENLMKGVV